ncbi:conserved membrane hypothetical protein [Vibrio chagasii]|nr:conserved membrane hypothetical protein [Vibrio chagasii]CAH6913166.1 conserved membrane hypothetical protein [Vibrio chagasii]CAH7025484.1 conserved membrane hypothetical protein [Vibrio chagasii]CAH7326307.1 conserved membrane hypothetical protein [Vibrio chagasii]CAH7348913.1 conserved membrane hypothetical protein [Vibrio chagasii]
MKYIQILPQLAALFFFPAMIVIITLAVIYEMVVYPFYCRFKEIPQEWKAKLEVYRIGSPWWSMSLKMHLCLYVPVLTCVLIAYLLQKHMEGTWLTPYEQHLVLAENICIGVFTGALLYWFTSHLPNHKAKISAINAHYYDLKDISNPPYLELCFMDCMEYVHPYDDDWNMYTYPNYCPDRIEEELALLRDIKSLGQSIRTLKKVTVNIRRVERALHYFDQPLQVAISRHERCTTRLIEDLETVYNTRKSDRFPEELDYWYIAASIPEVAVVRNLECPLNLQVPAFKRLTAEYVANARSQMMLITCSLKSFIDSRHHLMDIKEKYLPVIAPAPKGKYEVIRPGNTFKIPPRKPRKVDSIRGQHVREWRRS